MTIAHVRLLALAAGLPTLLTAAAHAQLFAGTIDAGDLHADIGATAPFPNMGPNLIRPTNFVVASQPTASQMYQYLWFYHVAGDTRSYNFNNEGGEEITQPNPATLMLTQHYSGWDATLTYQLVSTGPNAGELRATAGIHNLGTAPLTISLFHYQDLDLNNSDTNDLASLTAPGTVEVTDGGELTLRSVALTSPAAYEATIWRNLLSDLCNNSLTQLTSSGLPFGPGDFTMAWQWDLVIPAGGTTAVQDKIFVSSGAAPCYPNCDGSTAAPILNVNDFVCFLNRFGAGDSDANCDGSTTPPILNINDFICFQTRYAAGCP